MNLTSCNNCAVVLDKDKLAFPRHLYLDSGEIHPEAQWDGEEFIKTAPCPVCHEPVREK